MPRFAAFLRAVNVGGRIVPMEEVRKIFLGLGFTNVETFLASGNVVFESRESKRTVLERRLTDALSKKFGYEIPVFVRSASELAAISSHQPFSGARLDRVKTIVVGLMAGPLDATRRKALMAFANDNDRFEIRGRDFYWVCATSQSESTFSNMVFERALKVRATFRNVTTISRLNAKYFR